VNAVPDVRVATYNLYLGADLAPLFAASDAADLADRVERVRRQLAATRFEERAVAVAAVLARDRPDLVGLQEVARWSSTAADGTERVQVDFLATLVRSLAAAGPAYDVHAVGESFAGTLPLADGTAVSLSGANVTLVRRDRVQVLDERCAAYRHGYDVVTALDGLTFPVRRSWGRVDVTVDGTPLRFVNTHTEAYDAVTRDAQRDEVLSVSADVDGPVVVVGDFNAAPGLVGVPGPWVDAWTAGTGDGPTFGQDADLANETSGMRERIDYVWVRDAEVRRAWTVGDTDADRTVPHRLWPSDHAGVLADLRT
jgi:endonuclease/exonuclease/phosphatase family metal-dependent hydrolase